MKTLAIDTSTSQATIALAIDSLRNEDHFEATNKHSSDLLPHIDQLLKKNATTLQEIDVFACVLGPGSFTGLRIGLALIKGFAWSLQKPLVGLNSLHLLQRQHHDTSPVACMIHSRKGKIFAAAYDGPTTNDILVAANEYAIEEFLNALPSNTTLMGSVIEAFTPEVRARFPQFEYKSSAISSETILDLTQEKHVAKTYENVHTVVPWYMVNQVAKTKLEKPA